MGRGPPGDDDIHAERGEVVVGEKEGRVGTDGVAVFDLTGLAIQDIAAHVVYERATDAGAVVTARLVDTGG